MNVPIVYVGVFLGDRMRRALAVAALLACVLLMAASAARAETPFGGDPTQEVTPTSCQGGAPPYIAGSTSCLWSWSNTAVGTDKVPIPASGGSGTVTSVTLPAMPNPGPMQAVVLTRAVTATSEPSEPAYACCQVKSISPTFKVPANKIATVPLDLPVSATEAADLSHPGDTSVSDFMAISVLAPEASLPLRYTSGITFSSFDGDLAYFPAPGAPSSEFVRPVNPLGYQLLASFTYAPAGSAPSPGPGSTRGPAAKPGVKLSGHVFRPGADGKTLTLGKATNPPTAKTTQTLTVPAGAARAAKAGGKAKKPVVLGRGKTKIPSGKSVPLKLTLNSTGRAKLAKVRALKATLMIVATNAQGESQTITRAVTVKPAKPKKN